ncbi:uncharacterized protein LOC110401290, partial [Numida meleagris]|uniref:uncharacterized protein LOC110401290 n=1 Tax=Numida meleagris TaxID=8996 RepID=UPI000B3DC603
HGSQPHAAEPASEERTTARGWHTSRDASSQDFQRHGIFFRKSGGSEAPRGSPNPLRASKPTLFPRLLYFSRSAYSREVRDVPSSEWKLPSGTSFLLSSAGQPHCTLRAEPQFPCCERTARTQPPALLSLLLSPTGGAGLRDSAVPGAPRSRSRHPLPPDPATACFHGNRAVTQDFGTSWKPQPRAAAARGGEEGGERGAAASVPGRAPGGAERYEVRDEKLSPCTLASATPGGQRCSGLRWERVPVVLRAREPRGSRLRRYNERRFGRSAPSPNAAAALPPSGREDPQRCRTTLGRAPAAAPGVPRLLPATGRVAEGLRGGNPRGQDGLVGPAPLRTPAAHPPGAEARPSGAAQRPAVGPRQKDPGGRLRALSTAALRAPSGRGSPRSPRAQPLPRHFPKDRARGAALGTARSSHVSCAPTPSRPRFRGTERSFALRAPRRSLPARSSTEIAELAAEVSSFLLLLAFGIRLPS